MLEAEVLETLLYGCTTWSLGQAHHAKLRTVHHPLLLRITGFSRRQLLDHDVLSYSKALKQTQYESVETVVRKKRLLFAGAVAKEHNGRLPRRVMFGALSGGRNRSQAGQRRFGWIAYRTASRLSQPPAALLKTPRQVFGVETAL